MKYFISVFFLAQLLCLKVIGQSALLLRDDVTITLESTSLLYVNGDLLSNDSGDSSLINNQGSIELTGDLRNEGSGKLLQKGDGLLNMNGSSLQELSGNTVFNNLTIDNSSGVTILSGINQIDNTLTLTSGTLTTNDSLTLNSDTSRTARIAEITGGAISGDVIIERYLDSTDYDYRLLAMPVQGATLNEWFDDFIMTGFTGSQFPSFHFNSILFYDESVAGNNDTGFVEATNITNPVAMGQGVTAYTGGDEFVIDMKGAIYSGTQDLPVTFTDDPTQSDATEDGWNLVGNPYPSEIDWLSAGITRTNVDDAVYIYNGTEDHYASFVEGVGTNGGSRYIALGQAFYVKASAASPLLRISESAKSNQNQDFIARKAKPNLLSLKLIGSNNTDETILRFHSDASYSFDSRYDALKFENPTGLSIASNGSNDSTLYSIQSVPDTIFNKEIPLLVKVPITGMYQLAVNQLPSDKINCMFLHDSYTGRTENLRDSTIFHFKLYDTTTTSRFIIGYSPIVEPTVKKALCFNEAAIVTLTANDSNTVTYNWINNDGIEVTDSLNFSNVLKLNTGTHTIKLNKLGCSQQDLSLTITAPDSIVSNTHSILDSITQKSDAIVTYTGGVAPYQVQWNDLQQQKGDTAFQLNNGNYTVMITDSNNCSISDSILIDNTIVGLENIQSDISLVVYPNPITNFFIVERANGFSEAKIQLFDLNGKLVLTQKINNPNSKIDVHSLSTGTYLLKYLTPDNQQTFIKLQKH